MSTWSESVFAARMVLKRQTSPSLAFPSDIAEMVFWISCDGEISPEKVTKAWADMKDRYSLPRNQPDQLWVADGKKQRVRPRRRK